MSWKVSLGGPALALFLLSAWLVPVHAHDAGGSSDVRVKALAPYLQKYIPGNPTIVTEYMPGGGGRKAANYIYRSVRPDGLTIGSMSTTLVAAAILGEAGVLYDIDKFIYLGAPDSSTQHVFLTRKEIGLSNIDKLRAVTGIRIGAQAVGHQIYNTGRLFAFLLGLKEPKFVVGYSGPEVDIALQRGEVDARSHLAGSAGGDPLPERLAESRAVLICAK